VQHAPSASVARDGTLVYLATGTGLHNGLSLRKH
jgi:hypothetical protein